MCREKLSEIVFPTQFAHDLRDRQLRKNAMAWLFAIIEAKR